MLTAIISSVIAALVLTLLLAPARVGVRAYGRVPSVCFQMTVSPWPFLFNIVVYRRCTDSPGHDAERGGLDSITRGLSTIKRAASVIERALAPGHRIITFSVKVSLGTGDAASTAVLCGIVWTLVYAIADALYSLTGTRAVPPAVDVRPNYGDSGFSLDLYVLFQVFPIKLATSQGFLRAARRFAGHQG